MKLIDRVRCVKEKMPSSLMWKMSREGVRGRRILTVLDEDTVCYDFAVHELFSRAHRHLGLNRGSYVDLTFEYDKLMEIFDVMERFAHLAAFS